jgi:hypothetical protein
VAEHVLVIIAASRAGAGELAAEEGALLTAVAAVDQHIGQSDGQHPALDELVQERADVGSICAAVVALLTSAHGWPRIESGARGLGARVRFHLLSLCHYLSAGDKRHIMALTEADAVPTLVAHVAWGAQQIRSGPEPRAHLAFLHAAAAWVGTEASRVGTRPPVGKDDAESARADDGSTVVHIDDDTDAPHAAAAVAALDSPAGAAGEEAAAAPLVMKEAALTLRNVLIDVTTARERQPLLAAITKQVLPSLRELLATPDGGMRLCAHAGPFTEVLCALVGALRNLHGAPWHEQRCSGMTAAMADIIVGTASEVLVAIAPPAGVDEDPIMATTAPLVEHSCLLLFYVIDGGA